MSSRGRRILQIKLDRQNDEKIQKERESIAKWKQYSWAPVFVWALFTACCYIDSL